MRKAFVVLAFFLILLPFRGAFADVSVFPNPWMPGIQSGHEYGITFSNIGSNVKKIFIYDINGNLIKRIDNVQGSKRYNSADQLYYIEWDGRSDNGVALASGVYIYIVYDQSDRALNVGKFAVIR